MVESGPSSQDFIICFQTHYNFYITLWEQGMSERIPFSPHNIEFGPFHLTWLLTPAPCLWTGQPSLCVSWFWFSRWWRGGQRVVRMSWGTKYDFCQNWRLWICSQGSEAAVHLFLVSLPLLSPLIEYWGMLALGCRNRHRGRKGGLGLCSYFVPLLYIQLSCVWCHLYTPIAFLLSACFWGSSHCLETFTRYFCLIVKWKGSRYKAPK